ASSAKPNSDSALTSHRKSGSMVAAMACASASRIDGAGPAKRSRTFVALIFNRLPEIASTCSEVSLSARTVPALNAPSSSKKTCIGLAGSGARTDAAGEKSESNYTVATRVPGPLRRCSLCLSMNASLQQAEETIMDFRRLGDSGLEVSVICLGTMMFGDRTDAPTAQKMIASALDAGVNFIDTADVYAKGASE